MESRLFGTETEAELRRKEIIILKLDHKKVLSFL